MNRRDASDEGEVEDEEQPPTLPARRKQKKKNAERSAQPANSSDYEEEEDDGDRNGRDAEIYDRREGSTSPSKASKRQQHFQNGEPGGGSESRSNRDNEDRGASSSPKKKKAQSGDGEDDSGLRPSSATSNEGGVTSSIRSPTNKEQAPTNLSAEEKSLMALLDETPDTIIGMTVKMHGEMSYDKLLRIDGYFEGSLMSNGDLIVGPTGVLVGDVIDLKDVLIDGKVVGDISASTITLRNNAQVYGNLVARSLYMQSKVTVIGNLQIHPEAPDEPILPPELKARRKKNRESLSPQRVVQSETVPPKAKPPEEERSPDVGAAVPVPSPAVAPTIAPASNSTGPAPAGQQTSGAANVTPSSPSRASMSDSAASSSERSSVPTLPPAPGAQPATSSAPQGDIGRPNSGASPARGSVAAIGDTEKKKRLFGR